jgi:hypothetical protein
MIEEHALIWFAGLFEGEGCFGFNKGKAKGMSLTSTDEDVLLRIKKYFKGNVISLKRDKAPSNWKKAYIWSLHGEPAKELIIRIKPYLLKRRQKRSQEWLNNTEERQRIKEEKKESVMELILNAKKLRNQKLTHQEIGNRLGYERSYISKLLKK